jgi:hypothetical protein
VSAAPVDNEKTLHYRTVDACQTIRNYPGIFARMRRSMMGRVEERIESHGGHSENSFDTYAFRYNSQTKCFRTHVNMDIFSYFGIWNSAPKICPHLSAMPCIDPAALFCITYSLFDLKTNGSLQVSFYPCLCVTIEIREP